jgi:hypothetical protein
LNGDTMSNVNLFVSYREILIVVESSESIDNVAVIEAHFFQ